MRLALLLACFTAAACSSTSSSETPSPAPGVITPSDDGGAPPTADPPCAAPNLTFKTSPVSIAPARDHHATIVREVAGVPYLYVMGGEKDDFDTVFTDIQRSRIGEDGSLSPFETIGEIPSGLAGAAVATVGDDVVLVGGVKFLPQVGFTNEILVARFGGDGKLSAWMAGATLPLKVQHSSTVVVGRDVFIFGGTTGTSASTLSGKVTVNADGTLTPFTALTKLASPRSHHAAFLAQGSAYLVGGLDKGPVGNPPSLDSVSRAKILPDGTIGPWEGVGKLASPVSVAAAEVLGCSVLLLGGLDDTTGGPYSDRVLRGSVLADGTFRTESTLSTTLGNARGHVHQTPIYKNHLYSVGGREDAGDVIGAIDIGTVGP